MRNCYLTRDLSRIELAYICVSQSPGAERHAQLFVDTYHRFPAGALHTVTVLCNGGALPPRLKSIFKGPFNFLLRPNDPGQDISAYLQLADTTQADLLVCLGESVHFWKAGWLERIAQAHQLHGPGMYGFYSSLLVMAHMNTTAFAVSPTFLKQYPLVRDRVERYEFEHGQSSLWRRVSAQGYATKLVTWDGIYDPPDWRRPANILWRGDQSNCLILCNHTQRYAEAAPEVKRNWAMGADGFGPQRSPVMFRPQRTLVRGQPVFVTR